MPNLLLDYNKIVDAELYKFVLLLQIKNISQLFHKKHACFRDQKDSTQL
jgi:hypothetical protein